MTVRILVGDVRDPAELKRLYWDESLSLKEIAALSGVSHHTLRSRMRRANIPLRTRGEGTRLLVSKGRWPRGRITKSLLKKVLRCRSCLWSWKREDNRLEVPCPKCGAIVDARRGRGATAAKLAELCRWRDDNRDLVNANARRHRANYRRTALLVIGDGKIECVRCGCDDERLLEINHKNGGGRKELLNLRFKFYRMIARRERDTADLEICCRVCNALHYLESKFGPLPFRVEWGRR